jgi:hypothetical protein
MTEPSRAADPPPDPAATDQIGEGVWPSADYHRQVERLRAAVGETIYLVELIDSTITLGVRLSGTPFELLGVIHFPRPDPTRGLAPHLLLLDDGRGVNLGRIARVSRRPFAPAPADLLYLDQAAHENLLFAERRLSRDFLGARSRAVLGECLGYRLPELTQRLNGPVSEAPDAP